MSIKSNGILVDSNLYSPTWQDTLYNQLWQCLIDNNVLKSLTDKGYKKDQYGECSNVTYIELFFWSSLIDYFILLKADAIKANITTQEEVDTIIEGFNLDCFKEIARCRYNKVNIFNKLVEELGIAYDGLDFMIFDPSMATLSSEMVINGQFITDSVWSKGVNWIISPASGGDSAGEHNPSSLGYLVQDIGIERLSTYDVSFEIAGYGSGTNNMYLGDIGSTAFINITGTGIYTATLTTDNTIGGSQIFFESDNSLAVKNVSVKKHIQVPIITNGNDFIII